MEVTLLKMQLFRIKAKSAFFFYNADSSTKILVSWASGPDAASAYQTNAAYEITDTPNRDERGPVKKAT